MRDDILRENTFATNTRTTPRLSEVKTKAKAKD